MTGLVQADYRNLLGREPEPGIANYWNRKGATMKKQTPSALRLEHLEDRLIPSVTDYITSLFPLSAVNDTAVASGNWSSASTWSAGVPAAGQNIDIPAGDTVTFDQNPSASIQTLRIDGKLSFLPTANTKLLVDTTFVATGGELDIGTSANPIGATNLANLTFTDNGAINSTWDPLLWSRGLLSEGTVNIYGSQVTSFVAYAGSAAGATTITLSSTPTNCSSVARSTCSSSRSPASPSALMSASKSPTASAWTIFRSASTSDGARGTVSP